MRMFVQSDEPYTNSFQPCPLLTMSPLSHNTPEGVDIGASNRV